MLIYNIQIKPSNGHLFVGDMNFASLLVTCSTSPEWPKYQC